MKKIGLIGFLLIFATALDFQVPQLNSQVFFEIGPTAAADTPTVCTIHPNRSLVWSGETLELIVHVVTEDQLGVEVGLVTITDLNDSWSQDYVLQANSNGKLIVFRDIVSVSIEGKHVLQADYHGDVGEGYQASNSNTIVEFLVGEPTGVEPCNIIVELDTGIFFTNELFPITINVTRDAGAPPFYGGNIAVTALAEAIILKTYIIPSGFYLELSVELDVHVPLWFSAGMIDLTATFTDTKGYFSPASEPFVMDILDEGHQLAVSANPDPINRVNDQLSIRVDFAGDSATGKTLKVGWTDEVTNWTIDTRTVTDDPEIIPWSVPYTFSPGSYRVWVELSNPSTQYVYASADRAVTLFDYVELNWELNTTDLAPGDTVSYHFECSQQDVVIAVPSQILITDSEEGLIGDISTDALGVVDFVWNIPVDTPGGSHSQNVTVVPLDPNAGVIQQIFWIDLTLMGRTQLQLTYPAQIQRGMELEVAYQLSIENQDPVTEGQIYFTPPNDLMEVQDVEADGNGFFYLNISLDHPVGLQTFVVTYSGTESYTMAEEIFEIAILAEPHFGPLYVNATPVLPGQTLRIFGQLLDEVDQGIPQQSILFYVSDSIYLGSATTQADGSFAYNWVIPADAIPGLNVISAEYPGNASAGYLSPTNQPKTTSVLISNDIALEIPTIVVAGTTETLKIHGGWGTEVSIFWQGDWNAEEHLLVADVLIPASPLPYEVSWEVPLNRGEVTFRIEDSFQRTRFATTAVYVDPQYVFLDSSESIILYVDEEFVLNASCSESYRILVDGVPITTWLTTNTCLPLSFDLRGNHIVTMEITGSYVLEKTIKANFNVYEPVAINILVPSNITADSVVTIDITVASGLPGGQPLSGKDVSIVVYDVTRYTAIAEYLITLDPTGRWIFETDSLARGTYEVQVQVLAGQDWFEPKSESKIFYAVGQAYLEFTPPDSIIYNESVMLSATLHDNQGPISEKTIAFWWVQGENSWNLLGENITTAEGEAFFAWTPTGQPGDDYRLKAELVNPLDLGSAVVIKPVTVLAIPPTILSTHSILPNQNDTSVIAPGEYEVVVQVQENAPFNYRVFLAVNGRRISLSHYNGTDYFFQNGDESYWISSNGNALYVGVLAFNASGVYNVTVEVEDEFGTTNTLEMGIFAIIPPEILDVWSFFPESNEMSVVPGQSYVIVTQIQENSPMSYSVYLVVNDQKILMEHYQGEGFTVLAPNGTKYYIPANGHELYSGILIFPSDGPYDVELLIEDELGSVKVWNLGIFNATSAESKQSSENDDINGDSGRKNGPSTNEESIILLLIIGMSSGTVAFVGRPRKNKV